MGISPDTITTKVNGQLHFDIFLFQYHPVCSLNISALSCVTVNTSNISLCRSGRLVITTPLLNSSSGLLRSAVLLLLLSLINVPHFSWKSSASLVVIPPVTTPDPTPPFPEGLLLVFPLSPGPLAPPPPPAVPIPLSLLTALLLLLPLSFLEEESLPEFPPPAAPLPPAPPPPPPPSSPPPSSAER